MLNGCTTLTIEWALVLLSLAFVLLRVYVRFTSPSSGVNNSVTDTLVIFAWLALASMVACDSMLEKLSLLARPTPLDDKEVLILVNQNPEELVRMLKVCI